MHVSPLDLRQHRFKSSLRGFDRVEVTTFMAAVAEDYEETVREADRLRQLVTRMDAVITEHREHERTLKATLMTAQKLADDVKSQAEQEAARIVRDAEARAELLVARAQNRVEEMQHGVDNLKLKRIEAEASIESTIQTLKTTLEFIREQQTRERDERPREEPPREERLLRAVPA
jgi:cell division initiation protein